MYSPFRRCGVDALLGVQRLVITHYRHCVKDYSPQHGAVQGLNSWPPTSKAEGARVPIPALQPWAQATYLLQVHFFLLELQGLNAARSEARQASLGLGGCVKSSHQESSQ